MVMTALFSRKTPGGVYVVQNMEEHPNVVRFVHSAHSAAQNALGGGQSPDKPFSTLAYVMTNAASLTPALAPGDVLYVGPEHTETLSSAAAIACATAGVKVVGLGWGSARPTFTLDETDATWTITAAGVYLKNIRVTSGVAELVNMFTVSGADVTLDKVDFLDAGATFTTIQFLLTTTAADRLVFENSHHWKGTAAAAKELWIELIGIDGATIRNNYISAILKNDADAHILAGSGAASLGLLVENNRWDQRGGTTQDEVVHMFAGTTGLYSKNLSGGLVGTLAGSIDIADMWSSESFQATTVKKSGILEPVVA